MPTERLILYGGPPSQPSRAVYWTCLMKDLPFELRMPNPTADSGLETLNPKRQMPTIVCGDFVLYEMPAILMHLCRKHGWDDLYPEALETRALIDQYLHFHHSTTRLATIHLMAPHVLIAFGGMLKGSKDILIRHAIDAAMAGPDVYERGRAVIEGMCGLIESGYLREGHDYLCTREQPTIADIACYEELAQLRWAALFDFEGFPKLCAWLERMEALPFHEPVHRYNLALGDIRSKPNTMERWVAANARGIAALEELGVPIDRSD